MGPCCYCNSIHGIRKHLRRLIISLILLSSTHMRFAAEAKQSPFRDAVGTAFKPAGVAKKGGLEEEAMVVWPMVGSQPPRCERMCTSCARCEPIQVPAVPQDKKAVEHFSRTAAFRGDYSSNYRPVSWKCKCGDMIFNP